MVNLCSTYQAFSEALSCFVTHKDAEDETHWYLLWRRISEDTVIYTRDLPPALIDLREKVKQERKLFNGGREAVIPKTWKNWVEWLQKELTPPPGTTSSSYGVTTVDGNLQEVMDSPAGMLSSVVPPNVSTYGTKPPSEDYVGGVVYQTVIGQLTLSLKKLQNKLSDEEGVEVLSNQDIDNILKEVCDDELLKKLLANVTPLIPLQS
jgi:hypothetical protein